MRVKEFLIRLCVILPIALWSVILFLIILGIVAYLLGAESWFYCTIYCKIGVVLFVIVTIAVTIYQARVCSKK